MNVAGEHGCTDNAVVDIDNNGCIPEFADITDYVADSFRSDLNGIFLHGLNIGWGIVLFRIHAAAIILPP